MADNVQWIRLKVGMFDGNSFKKIKRAKIGGVSYRDKLTAVWFELLDLAGKSNANGYLIDNNEIPYQSYSDIATMLDREDKEIELCMQFYITEKMVEIVDDVYLLTNFVQYQNQAGLEKIREQNRERQARFRDKKKQLLLGTNVTDNDTDNSQSNVTSRYEYNDTPQSNANGVTDNVTSHQSNATDKELDKEIDNNIHTARTREGDFETQFNTFCKRWRVTVDNYSPLITELDFEKLNKAYEESTKFLQVAPVARTISWVIKNVASIYAGKYKDKPNDSTTKKPTAKQIAREQTTDILKNLFNEYRSEENNGDT